MKIRLLFILTAMSITAGAIDLPETRSLIADERSQALLAEKIIRAETGGSVPVGFDAALSVLRRESFLENIQQAYEEMLPPGETTEFTIREAGEGTWFYINRKGERTDITEVAAGSSAADLYDLAYFTEGRRFFGDYRALIHIRLVRASDATDYRAAVYAYPENKISRFFARHLKLVERYFHSKTDEISDLAIQISTRLCNVDSFGEESTVFALQKTVNP